MTITIDPFSDVRTTRRAAFASFVGTSIEWYDYYIFGTAAVLVLNSQFFPSLSPFAASLASFATFGVAFVARPLGGLIFGHLGDRVGRKKTLVLSIVAMGVATVGVGLLPTYASIGVWAPVLLVAMRLVQGLAVGGEWGGAVLMALEHAPVGKRSFYASWPQCGVPVGTVLSAGVFFLVQQLPEHTFLAWGWRVPFIASAILVVVGLYIRLNVAESPEFAAARRAAPPVRIPALEVLRSHPRALLSGMFCGATPNVLFYLATVYMLSYAPKVGISRNQVFVAMIVGAALQIVAMPGVAQLADRFSARTILLVGCLLVAPSGFVLFGAVATGSGWATLAAYVCALPVAHTFAYAALSSFTAELFPTRVRFSGTSMAYQFGGVINSAPVPLLAAYLLQSTGTTHAISLYVVLASVLAAGFIACAPRRPTADGSTSQHLGGTIQ
jgi:metabolite-proton symporter